jgi:DNA-binding GntR family transcriptional regulator
LVDLSARPPATATSEWIAAALRQAILRGEFKAGQPLLQDEVAARFGVSKIPAREALLQLKAEGLVSFYPNRGATVSELSAGEVNEIYIIRIALETLALRHALSHLTRADFVRLEGLIAIMDDERDPLTWSELNWEFHAALYQPCGMPRLMAHIHMLHANVQRYLVGYLASQDYYGEAQRQHRAILRACRQGDIEAAADQLTEHLAQAAEKMSRLLQAHNAGRTDTQLHTPRKSE